MNRQLALLLCLPLVLWLWTRDNRTRPILSPALWLPLAWLLILGSRPVSWWLGMGSSIPEAGATLEGSPLDRAVYLSLILSAIVVLNYRRLDWSTLASSNKALLLFYAYLLCTALWSDYPFVTCKRWFKDFGLVFAALIILTDRDALQAVKVVFARCAYVLFPLSVVFIKYFPDLGRRYGVTGIPEYIGVTSQKNTLGEIVLVFGLILVAEVIRLFEARRDKAARVHLYCSVGTLLIGLWLLHICDSKTAMICFAIGSLILISPRLPLLSGRPKLALWTFICAIPIFYAADSLFSVKDSLLSFAGRDSTFTNRTVIWDAISDYPVDPLLGKGFLMFWDTIGPVTLNGYQVLLRTAHNGYIEIYLDGGIIGLCFLCLLLLSVAVNASRDFLQGSEYGRLRLAFFIIAIIYNLSESMFARLSPLWFAFLLFALNGWQERTRDESDSYEDDEPSWLPRRETSPQLVTR